MPPKKPVFDEVSVADVAVRLESVILLDANPRRRYDKGHLPGAVLVDPAEVGAVLPEDTSAPLVFYCKDRSCGAAPAAARRAVKQGYTDVSVMPEGIDGWEQAGHPTVSS